MPTKKAPDVLPGGAKKIWISAFNGSWKDTCKDRSDRDECAAKIAWSAVKKKYKKSGDTWVKKSEMLKEFSIAIVKASLDKATGEMRWRAVASDTDKDNFGDNMTLTLFNDFMRRIKSNQKAPDIFCSEYWQGGMPYLSIAHYSDNNGKSVPGDIESVYIDGNRLKGKGTFTDTPLGRACFKAVCADLYADESDYENKVRLSIGFLDFAHRHKSSGTIFKRTGPGHACKECTEAGGHGNMIEVEYLEGMLLHWALTRVPINPRTDMEVDKSMSDIKTRQDDAKTIVGEELAKDLDTDEVESLIDKSEAMVVKSEQDEDEAVASEDPQIDEGKGTSPEPEVEKGKHDEDDEDEDKAKEKADVDVIVVETLDNLPAGGAVSLEEVADNREARQEAVRLHELWWDLGDVMFNIFERSDVDDKKAAISRAIEEFRDMLEMKALHVLSEAEAEADATPLDQAFDILKENIESAKADEEKTEDEILESVQESFDTLGSVVVESVRGTEGEVSPAKSVAANIEKAVTKALQPLADQLGLLVATMGAKTGEEVVRSAFSQPRNLQLPPVIPTEQTKPTLKEIVRKSVGL